MSRFGQVSRRSAVKAVLSLVAGGLAASTARAQDAGDQPKLDRKLTKYQYHPNAEGSHCSICSNFIAPASCKVIAGIIDPNGYCLAFAPMDQ